jgi:indole-3-glycerol phosphate synthase
MSTILDKINADKRTHVNKCKEGRSEAILLSIITLLEEARGFQSALQAKVDAGEFALIAEIKKASPSKGVIREDFDPASLAASYKAGGAACLSVLTDVPYFQGDDKFVGAARKSSGLPVLRKDFMIDPYQVVEARAIGADCILLIMASLSDAQAKELEDAAKLFSMDVLVEVHNEEELERALKLDTTLLGINNRDLKTFEIDLAVTERLVPHIPEGYLTVCESGVFTHDDVQRMRKSNVNTFLVGESLMRQDDVTTATKTLLGL